MIIEIKDSERITADWCPKCGADWTGPPIPPEHLDNYGGATHYSRVIAIYDRELDRTVAWECPDCHARIEGNPGAR